MATWYVHLGFQWSSPLIGSVWNLGTASDEYRFLQYALAKDQAGNTPAWFNFQTDDVLNFLVWDLGPASSSPPNPSIFNLGFSYLDSAATYDPSTLVRVSDTSQWSSPTTASGNAYVQSTSFSGSPSSNCPWGSYGSGYAVAGSIQLQTSVQCKLSFYLEVAGGSNDSQTFISDPEVIIGPNGNPS